MTVLTGDATVEYVLLSVDVPVVDPEVVAVDTTVVEAMLLWLVVSELD